MAKNTDNQLAHSLQDLEKRGLGSRSFLYDEIGDGRLKATKLGRRIKILDADLQSWLASQPKAHCRPNASKVRRAKYLERQRQRRERKPRSRELAADVSGHQ
ncbi:MAG TPA: hypothetical protein VKF35_10710 [Hyphomicrobiaceae bacterium]|nr:hypothetical protein [Hyphomicrobiaceae bacterium]